MKKYIVPGILCFLSNLICMEQKKPHRLPGGVTYNAELYEPQEESCTISCLTTLVGNGLNTTHTKGLSINNSSTYIPPYNANIGDCIAQLWLLWHSNQERQSS